MHAWARWQRETPTCFCHTCVSFWKRQRLMSRSAPLARRGKPRCVSVEATTQTSSQLSLWEACDESQLMPGHRTELHRRNRQPQDCRRGGTRRRRNSQQREAPTDARITAWALHSERTADDNCGDERALHVRSSRRSDAWSKGHASAFLRSLQAPESARLSACAGAALPAARHQTSHRRPKPMRPERHWIEPPTRATRASLVAGAAGLPRPTAATVASGCRSVGARVRSCLLLRTERLGGVG